MHPQAEMDAVRAWRYDGIDELADGVLEIAGPPVDAWAVTATLESRGMRDVDAVERYGHRDVFELGERVLARCLERPHPASVVSQASRSRIVQSVRFARHLARGTFFFVPLALQMVALFAVGYSQWASVDFTLAQASTIAMSAGASFLATAGFVQALGYLGPLLDEPGKGFLTERLTWSLTALAMLGAFCFGGAFVGANALIGAYPGDLVYIGVVYYALLAASGLANGVLYMVRSYLAMLVATVAGIAVVVGLREGMGLEIYAAQWIGLAASVGISLAWGAVILRRRARATRGTLRLARFQPRRQLVRAAAPFFCYGALYFALVLCDRLVAWSAGNHPLPVWFDVAYELGLDVALVAVVVSLGFLEHTVEAFTDRLGPAQDRFSARAVRDHNRHFLRFYAGQLLATLTFALVGVGLAYLAVSALATGDWLGDLERYAHGAVAPRVFAWAAAGYVLLAWGLLNTTFLFSLARPWLVVVALGLGVAVDAGVGLALSRTGAYWEGVIGLSAGCAVFAVLSTAMAIRTLGRTDYHYVAAY